MKWNITCHKHMASDGGIQFYAQSGTWVHGLSVGQAEIIDSVTSKHSQEDFWGWQISLYL